MTWVSSVMDLEARWKYSRWVHGHHAVLLDQGETPNAEHLVAEMDEHICSMAELLEQPVPDSEFPWVKGALVGQNGRAILSWALCGQEDNSSELTYLDRHEVAHTLITVMGGMDHDPPFVFIEGWAESQSRERGQLIRMLSKRHEDGRTYSLQELVGPDWYCTGKGPVYWEGGPIVIYLLERYGPKKFLELYSGVRRQSFYADCQAILGNSWQTVEDEFWPWLEVEAMQLEAEEKEELVPAEINFVGSVNPDDWHSFVAGYRQSRGLEPKRLPVDASIHVELNRTVSDEKEGLLNHRESYEFRAIFRGENIWAYENSSTRGDQFLMTSPEQCATLYGDQGSGFGGWVKDGKSSHQVRDTLEMLMRMYSELQDPADLLPLYDETRLQGSSTTITEIIRPKADEGGVWKLSFRRNNEESEISTTSTLFQTQIEVDPNLDWLITIMRYNSGDGKWESVTEHEYQRFGQKVMPKRVTVRSFQDEKNYVEVEEKWRQLIKEEQTDLKRQVEKAVWFGPRQSRDSRYRIWLRRLMVAAIIGCPLCGVLLLRKQRKQKSVEFK